jgi:integrase
MNSASPRNQYHLKQDEIAEVLEMARKTSSRDWCVIVLAMNHCCRVSELVGGAPATKDRPSVLPLLLNEVTATRISIRRLKGSDDTPNQPLINHRGKPLFSDKAAIDAYLKERIEDGSGLFFTGQKGRMTRWTVEKMFRQYCKLVNANRMVRGATLIPDEAMRFHALKHTGCSTVAQQTKNLFAVMQWAGHRSVSSAMIYQHPDARTIASEVQQAFSRALAAA